MEIEEQSVSHYHDQLDVDQSQELTHGVLTYGVERQNLVLEKRLFAAEASVYTLEVRVDSL